MGEEQFLAKNFRDYYSGHKVSVPAVDSREFGVGDFGKKIAKRHISFQSNNELNSFLAKQAPLYISYSIAYYQFPSRSPMSSKEMEGADLIYEFDADDLKTECKESHDSWSCPKCGSFGKGAVDHCSKCASPVKKEQWFCPVCLNETKSHTLKLLDFIENDFNFSEGVAINFSGNAGYHVHVRGGAVRKLGVGARLELLDYLTGKDFDLSNLGFYESNKMFICPLGGGAEGWAARLLFSLEKLFKEGRAEKIAALGGISYKKAAELVSRKETVLSAMKEKGILPSISGRGNKQFWESLLSSILVEGSLGIDRQTSADIRKIIRVPDTLHGGTGLVAKSIARENLAGFNPLKDTVVFEGESVRVFINKSPKFYLAGEWFGPFKEEEFDLPLAVAIYLVGKGRAKLRV